MNHVESSCLNSSKQSVSNLTETQKLILDALGTEGVERPGFYGILSFHFQNGRLTIIRREQTTVPQSAKHEEKHYHATCKTR